jgi:cyclopropane-fatty-acyl-phospholipid synthase
VGFAEGYLRGFWDTPDLVALLDVLAADIVARSDARRPRVPLRAVQRLRHGLRTNTRAGSRANVTQHYDLGNDFYRLWLDPTMSYSCALFSECSDTTDAALEAAQTAKWDRLLDLVGPRPGDRLLEVGSGWGGLALHAARTRGCRVVGNTHTREQLA